MERGFARSIFVSLNEPTGTKGDSPWLERLEQEEQGGQPLVGKVETKRDQQGQSLVGKTATN